MKKEQRLTAFIFVKVDCRMKSRKTAASLARISEAEEVHRIAGDDCYLVKVRVENTEALERLIREKFNPIASVYAAEATIVLKTVKESAAPLAAGAAPTAY